MAADLPRSKRKHQEAPYVPSQTPEPVVVSEVFSPPLDPHAPEPLYAQIAQRLRDAIHMHKILPGSRLPSESDLCNLLRVSRNTVMRAINDLRDEGLLYRERGSGTYVRYPAHSAQQPPATARLGIVSPTSRLSMDDLYLGGILSGLSQTLQELSAVAMLGSPSVNPSSDYFTEITRRDIDGFFVIAPSMHDYGAVSVLARNAVPFVLVGAVFDPKWDAVTADNRLGIRLAVEHLRSLGHTHIALIGAPEYDYDSSERWAGFHDLWPASSPRWTLRLGEVGAWEEQIHTTLASWLVGPEAPTAVISAGYPLTLATLRSVRSLGIDVPERLSIIGYDDYTMMEYLAPPLTTVRQPLAAMGATAARLLTAKVRGQVSRPVHHVLPTQLMVRGSTGPPPSD